MQILHRFAVSIQRYSEELSDPIVNGRITAGKLRKPSSSEAARLLPAHVLRLTLKSAPNPSTWLLCLTIDGSSGVRHFRQRLEKLCAALAALIAPPAAPDFTFSLGSRPLRTFLR